MYFFLIYILYSIPKWIAMEYIDEICIIYRRESEQVIQLFFYARALCVFILSILYSYIQSFHPLHYAIDVHCHTETRNCRLSWKCNFDLDRQTPFYATKHILFSQTQRILNLFRFTFSHNE